MTNKIKIICVVVLIASLLIEIDKVTKLRAENEDLKLELELALDSITEVEPIETHQDILKLACERYEVPYDIAYAIARLETDNFKSKVLIEMNNLGGMCYNEGEYIYFENLADGIDRFVRMLKVYYLDHGLDTPKKMQEKYCPFNDEWAKRVEELMEG